MADLLHLVDKPDGWTSHDAVARMRRILGVRRVGHAGTLDPFASGLLVMGEGRATPLLGCVALLPKRYVARALLGVETDTQDRTGRILRRSDAIPSLATIDAALEGFRGRITQRPPLYSARKVGGERLYRAARRGEDPERAERPVHVYELRRVEAELPEITLDLIVSRGTYVRTIAHDLGQALGCGAHLTALRRVASGPFRAEDALSPERASGNDAARFRERAITPERALSFLPSVRLEASEAAGIRHGKAPVLEPGRVERPEHRDPLPPGEPGWPLALLDPEGSVLALARPIEAQPTGAPATLLRVLVTA